MSTLIFGGLGIIVVLALLGLVFVIRTESKTEATKPAPMAVREQEQNVPTTPVAEQEVASVPAAAPTSTTRELSVPGRGNDERLLISNGQLRELVNELHMLHQRAQEIEHRLSILTEMVDRADHAPRRHMSIEELNDVDADVVNIN